jgi:hypothetical protein
MLPVEATALIGSLAGITELAQASFGEDAALRRGGRVPNTGGGS